MATKNTTAGAETAAPEKVQAAKFTVERLAANCRQLFGVSSCAYAGGLRVLISHYATHRTDLENEED